MTRKFSNIISKRRIRQAVLGVLAGLLLPALGKLALPAIGRIASSVMKNTLEFDPEVLKRYVNFMNNPDEKTAIEQFGNGDKYFGVATVLAAQAASAKARRSQRFPLRVRLRRRRPADSSFPGHSPHHDAR